MSQDDRSMQVRRRRVFYIPGYDPFPPRRYRELYRTEAEAQARISGYEVTISARPAPARSPVPVDDLTQRLRQMAQPNGEIAAAAPRPAAPPRDRTPDPAAEPYGWRISARMDGAEIETEYEVLAWGDLVRRSMAQSIPATYAQMLRTAWIYLSTGTLRRLFLLRKGPVIAALYPIAVLTLQALLAFLVGWIPGHYLSALTLPGLGWVLTIPVFVLVLRWFRSLDHILYAYYLMHDYAFSAGLQGANRPELDDRMAQFRNRIAAALRTGADEVLVVGHSTGAQLAVHILADLSRDGFVRRDGPALSLLTLGQVIPMVSFLPRAWRLRAELHDLGRAANLSWIDISAPGDGCSFALCDPVSVSGVAPKEKRWPLVLSAAFSQSLSASRWNALKKRYFRLHFQYLCAFDRARDYDYFRITAGPMTLGERFAGRPPSKSRIDVSVSAYTSMVA